MKKAFVIFAAVAIVAAQAADTNELERLRVASVEARKAYIAARKAAGLPAFEGKGKRGAAATTTATTFTKSQKRFFENRRYCVSRDTETIPGSVITTWYRNGKPDTKAPAVVTNVLHRIAGAEQMNPLQFVAEQFRQRAEEWQSRAEQWQSRAEQWQTEAERWLAQATDATARVERVTAALDEKRAEYVEKRDAATLPSTKLLYQAFIDAIDRIKARLDSEGAK